jgi:uncharacterized repeat protein (TIGR03803 family)
MARSNKQQSLKNVGRMAMSILASLFLLSMVVVPAARAQTLTVLHTFTGGADGGEPQAGLAMDRAGNLYGTTKDGGIGRDQYECTEDGEFYGCGTLYKLSHHGSSWVFNLLYQFTTVDGAVPVQAVTIGPNGSVYGPTTYGGPSCPPYFYGCGTIFNASPGPTFRVSVLAPWFETVLFAFPGLGQGGPNPSSVTFDTAGNIYGTTPYGPFNFGDIYELTHSRSGWTENILYNFTGGADGELPTSVIFDPAGNLYGATSRGGNNGCSFGCGTIFQLTPSGSGWTKTILHTFNPATDGGYPGAVVRDQAGNLYGMAAASAYGEPGNVWELSPAEGGWTFTVLYWFATSVYNGSAALAMDASGNLYGVTAYGGTYSNGNVFKLARSEGGWTYTDLYDFTGGNDGCHPLGSVTLDADGNIYGTTSDCGADGGGTVYKLAP